MGTFAATDAQYIFDQLHNRINARLVTPMPNMLQSCTNPPLNRWLDQYGIDPDLQAALLGLAADVDRMGLRRNQRAYFDAILGDATEKAFISGVNAFNIGADGGDYDNLYDWMNTNSITVSPVAAEAIRKALGEACFTSGTSLAGALHPYMNVSAFEQVWYGLPGALVEATTEMAATTPDAITPFAVNNGIVVLRSTSQFNQVFLEISTPADATITPAIYYWNGAAWTAVSGLSDLTTGMTVNGGRISWSLPTDEVPSAWDAQATPWPFNTSHEEELYSIMIKRTNAAGITPPKFTALRHIPEAVETAAGKLYGLVGQPPLAICRITAADTIVVSDVQAAQHDRFVPPGTTLNGLKLVALTDMTADVTFTLAYTSQAGSSESKAQSAWAGAIAMGDTKTLALDTGDTGVRAVLTTSSAVTTNTAGIFAVIYNAWPRAISSM